MAIDFLYVLQWWSAIFFLGLSGLPLTRVIFRGWWDQGYSLSKALGLACITYIVYVFGSVHAIPFSIISIMIASFLLFGFGYVLEKRFLPKELRDVQSKISFKTLLLLELFFGLSLLAWSWIKAHEPAIHGLEKFMGYGLTQSILNTDYFPPNDKWYAGHPINYYYFGHISMALLSYLSAVDLSYGFNIMLATLFAFTFTMSFSIGVQLQKYAKSKRQNSKLQINSQNNDQDTVHSKTRSFWKSEFRWA